MYAFTVCHMKRGLRLHEEWPGRFPSLSTNISRFPLPGAPSQESRTCSVVPGGTPTPAFHRLEIEDQPAVRDGQVMHVDIAGQGKER